ncbi:MAG TPA: protealysin inhibitor emfourin [Gemmatimonadaceae bacterium]|nr:protealysin inhibitor emfourin [Gemmatimonadaceae bacterium]
MIIQIYQSGGFAGDNESLLGRTDTSRLAPAEQERVQKLARAIEKSATEAPMGADMITYRIQIQPDDGPERTVVVEDDMNPNNPALRSLHELTQLLASGT